MALLFFDDPSATDNFIAAIKDRCLARRDCALRFVKGGSPPTPAMAIEEAQLIKQTVQSSRPAKPIGAGGRTESSDPAARAEARR